MEKSSKIYVAGHTGMVGSAILRKLHKEGYTNIVVRTSAQLDLRDQQKVALFFEEQQIEYVFVAAAKVGGIMANNTYKADFLYHNLQIQNNLIHYACKTGVSKLLFLGSSCIYPKMAPQPLQEDSLLTGALEPTNEPYAIAKLAGIRMCQAYRHQYQCNFICALPASLYGINDNYHPQNSHVLPALIRRFHEAKMQQLPFITMWGTGSPKREFLYVDDMADACYFLMQNYNGAEAVNIGTGKEESIAELAHLVKNVVGYEGGIENDLSKPDGTPRKVLDVSKLTQMGWTAKTDLTEGLEKAYLDFLVRYENLLAV